MKKFLLGLLIILTVFGLVACGGAQKEPKEVKEVEVEESLDAKEPEEKMPKVTLGSSKGSEVKKEAEEDKDKERPEEKMPKLSGESDSSDKEKKPKKDSDPSYALADMRSLAATAMGEEVALEAWDIYVLLEEDLEFFDHLFGEGPASSKEEVKKLLDTYVKDLEHGVTEFEISEGYDVLVYQFYDPEDVLNDILDMNYADINFYFFNDELYMMNISPGIFTLEITGVVDNAPFANYEVSLEDLLDDSFSGQVFSISKYHMMGDDNYNIMIATKDGDDYKASYNTYLPSGEAIVNFYTDFVEVADNFPAFAWMTYLEDLEGRIEIFSE